MRFPWFYIMADAPIKEKSDGFLECEECAKSWCEHVQDAVTKRLDGVSIWERIKHFDEVAAWQLMVPIFPDFGFWAEVELSQYERIPSAREVIFKTEVGGIWNCGFVYQGDSRYTIRSMILEQFAVRGDVDGFECNSTSHGLIAQAHVEETRSRGVIQHNTALNWSLYFYGMCLLCNPISTPIDFTGLVPDDEGRRRAADVF